MAVYRFKVSFEDDENVWREIEIKSTQTFEDFHNCIQTAIKFDDAHSASFYVATDTWRKEKEVRILRSRKALQKGTWMHETKIASLIDDPHQKFVYEFDPDGPCWTLHVELSKILPDSPIDYPRISKSNGNAPAQYKATIPGQVISDEDDEELLEEDDAYVHKVDEHYEEKEEGEEEGPTTLRTKTEAEMTEEESGDKVGEEEPADEYEEGSGFEEEDI